MGTKPIFFLEAKIFTLKKGTSAERSKSQSSEGSPSTPPRLTPQLKHYSALVHARGDLWFFQHQQMVKIYVQESMDHIISAVTEYAKLQHCHLQFYFTNVWLSFNFKRS